MKTVPEIARICYEVNRGLCVGIDEQPTPVGWDDAPQWQRDTVLAGVQAIVDGQVRTPEDSHRSWCAEKTRTGWKYGKFKDAEAKTHPCLVSYHELPDEQRLKDTLFFAVVEGLRE